MNQQDRILSRDQLRGIVPAAFSHVPAPGLSDRYSFISTEKLMDQMAERGWAPVGGMQSRTRNVASRMFATHVVTFEKLGQSFTNIGGLVGRVMLINNHAGRMARKLMSGFLRLICLNGLVADSGIAGYSDRKVHTGDAHLDLNIALIEATARLETAQAQIEQWRSIELPFGDRMRFAREALALRNPDSKPIMSHPVLRVRREEDKGSDLWTVFNRVQENLVQGGVMGVFHPRRSLRAIRGVISSQEINRGLWSLATRFAAERAA